MKILLPVISYVLYLTTTISCQTDECTKALQHCVRDFMDKILQLEQQNNSQLICQDLQILTKCAFNQTCKIPEERRRPFIENVQKEMRTLKFDCDLGIDVDSNTAEGSSRLSSEEENESNL